MDRRWMNPELPVDERVEALLREMTIAEKVGQLNQMHTRVPLDEAVKAAREGLMGSRILAVNAYAGNTPQPLAYIANVDGPELPEDLMDLNPYHTVPTLVDRDLVLYDSRVIIEYLDERFPHPPLMPVDPVTRAQFRLALFRIETDWYSLAEKRYFLSDEFSLVDCTIAPVLWRLPLYGIELPSQAKPIQRYMDDVFSRPSFQASLTELEQEMRM